MSDLSPYELQRLENIKRNNAALAALGLTGPICAQSGGPPPKKKAKKKKKPKPQERRSPERPTRTSARLRGASAPKYDGEKVIGLDDGDAVGTDEEDEEPAIDYEQMPVEPQHLDDAEFEVYVALRAWRLARCRELQTEAYKICQNRTLCELVRRRRNDAAFGAGAPKPLATGFGLEPATDEYREEVLEVWGIGPSKVETCALTKQPLFVATSVKVLTEAAAADCPEMLTVLDRHEKKLQASRDSAKAEAAAAEAETEPADGDAAAAEGEAEGGVAAAAASEGGVAAAAESTAAACSPPVRMAFAAAPLNRGSRNAQADEATSPPAESSSTTSTTTSGGGGGGSAGTGSRAAADDKKPPLTLQSFFVPKHKRKAEAMA